MVKPAVYTIDQQKGKEKAIEAGVVTEIPKKTDATVGGNNDLEVGVTNGRCSHRARKLTAVIILTLLIIGTITVIALFAVHQSQKSHKHGDWEGHDGGKPDCSGEDDDHPIDNDPRPPEEHQGPGHNPHHEIGGNDGHDDHHHPDDDHHDGGDHDDDDGPDHHHGGDHEGPEDGDRPGHHHEHDSHEHHDGDGPDGDNHHHGGSK